MDATPRRLRERIGFRVALGCLVLLSGYGFPAQPDTEWDPASKNWRLGPVKYLLTKAEDKKFKSLKTDQARERFVKEFWEKRDPTPGTDTNEFRDNFWQLVDEANREFESIRGGWSTDQGRILILFGAPAEQARDTDPGGALKRIRWEYAETSVLGQAFTVLFVPEEDEFVLANIREVDEIIDQVPELIGLGEKPEIPVVKDTVAAAPPPPELPAEPEIEMVSDAATRLLDGLADGNAARREIRFQVRWDYFEAKDDTTHSVLNIGVIPPPALDGGAPGRTEDLEVCARLVPANPMREPVDLTRAASFQPAEVLEDAPSGPFHIYQARVSLPPGSYQLYAVVRNRSDGRAGTLKEAVEVPAFSSSDLTISTITLANSIQPLSGADTDAEEPSFTFGHFRVVPRIEPVFRSSEDLNFYYQVYNAKKDPATSRPRLDIEYQFLMKRGSAYQVAASVPKEGQETAALGFSLPLQGWPATDYRLRINVTDQVAGRTTSREIDFKVQ